MLNETVITFDVDWASDKVIDAVAARVSKMKVNATWFITHDSLAIRRLMKYKNFEIGLHPNFLQGTTQGKSPGDVMRYLRTIAPKAISVRTHAMVYSAQIARMFALYGMQIDSSIYLGGMPTIQPFTTEYPDGKKLLKMPYFAADDAIVDALNPLPSNQGGKGMRVYCFHPIHLFLNTARWEDYISYRDAAKENPATNISDFINSGLGVFNNIFQSVVDEQKGRSRTLKQIAQEEGLI